MSNHLDLLIPKQRDGYTLMPCNLIPYVTSRSSSSNVPTPPDEDTCHETEDAPGNSSSSIVIETPDNVSPQEAASNTETCEDRSTVKPRVARGNLGHGAIWVKTGFFLKFNFWKM